MATPASGQTPPSQQPKPVQRGIVKAVSSGDTIVVLLESKTGGPPPEKEITFSGVKAPRLGRPETKSSPATKDEPYAFEAREFLRRKLIGKQVTFVIDGKNPNTNREFGVVSLGTENVVQSAVAAGFVRVTPPPPNREMRKEQVELTELQTQAQEEKKGLWAKEDEKNVRNVLTKYDHLSVYEKFRGKPQNAVVEQVRNGSQLRLLLIPSYHVVVLSLAGALAPRVPFNDSETPEPFAQEAKFFVERNLLHRDVQALLTGVDKSDNFIGKVVDRASGRSLAEELIKMGLASYVEWSAPQDDREKLQGFEKTAKEQNLRIWTVKKKQELKREGASAAQIAAAAASAPSPADAQAAPVATKAVVVEYPKEVAGRVREIKNNNEIVIAESGSKFTISLSSITIPRLGGPNWKEEPGAYEAREFLRSRLIGKKVVATLDYVRPANDQKKLPEKAFYTVTIDSTNISTLLVERGLARVIRYRDDQARSPHYEALVLSEMRAEKKGKGVHSKATEDVKRHVNDLSVVSTSTKKEEGDAKSNRVDLNKLRQYLPFLRRGGKLNAVVEYVYSATRAKLHIPKEGCIINFSLSAVRAQQKRGDTAEPYADESLEYAREHLHQFDVEIEVEAVDKVGNFLGNLWIKKKNFATQLLEEGYASAMFNAKKSPYANEYLGAENAAKAKKLRIWENWDPAAEEARLKQLEEAEQSKPSKAFINVIPTCVVDGGWFFANIAEDIPKLENLMKEIADSNPESAEHYDPTSGALCLAKFSADGRWYRAKAHAGEEDDTYNVTYIDYGNTEVLAADKLRKISKALAELPQQAKEIKLAYIKVPEINEDWGDDAADFLKDCIWDKTMIANVEYRDGHVFYVTLVDPEDKVLVNAQLLSAGLARVEHRRERYLAPLIGKFREEEDKAKKARACMWQYGDVADDEDEEGAGRRGGRR